MGRMKQIAAVATCAVAIGATSSLEAHADPAGTVQWQCLGTDGVMNPVPPGQPLNSCKGAYLKKYIDGKNVQNVNLTSAGTPADGMSKKEANCLVALVGATAAVLSVEGTVVWVVGAAATGWGLSACAA